MEAIINLKDYTVTEHVLFALGCLLWVFTYFIVIHNIRRRGFVEVPVIAVCANFGWEFLWSFVFQTDMGELYVWGYRIWFFLDCFILYGLFKYGHKQIAIPSLEKIAKPIIVFGLLAWGAMLYYYIDIYDQPLSHMGAYSGYILNVMMSAMYIPLFLRLGTSQPFSKWAAWLKGVGTLLISAFCFLKFTDGFLLSMCVVTTLLDAAYIYLVMQKQKA